MTTQQPLLPFNPSGDEADLKENGTRDAINCPMWEMKLDVGLRQAGRIVWNGCVPGGNGGVRVWV